MRKTTRSRNNTKLTRGAEAMISSSDILSLPMKKQNQEESISRLVAMRMLLKLR